MLALPTPTPSFPLKPTSDSPPTPFILLLSGTHVTGKETLAFTLSTALHTPWLKAEALHASTAFGARSQAGKGFDYHTSFSRIWLSKIQRAGILADCRTLPLTPPIDAHMEREPAVCKALLSCHAMRKPARDAIRDAMRTQGIRVVFVVMQITEEVLAGRTLGAEEAGLAGRIMREKIADIEIPTEEEEGEDVIVVDSMRNVDGMFGEIRMRVRGLVGGW